MRMTTMVVSTWDDREALILRAVIEASNAGSPIQNLNQLCNVSGLQRQAVEAAVPLLIDGGYLHALDAGTLGGPDWLNLRPTALAMRESGAWPATRTERRSFDADGEPTIDPPEPRLYRINADAQTEADRSSISVTRP